MTTYTTTKQFQEPDYNSSNWNVPLNSNFQAIDNAFGGTVSIAVGASGTFTLAATDVVNYRIVLTGAPSSAVTIVIPITNSAGNNVAGYWVIDNQITTASPPTVTIKNAFGGSTVIAPKGYRITVISDPTTGVYLSNDGLFANLTTISTAGSAFFATTSGGVAIGASSVTGKLDVVGSSGTFRVPTTGDGIVFTKAGTNTIGTNASGGKIQFQVAATTNAVLFDSTGNVGIGSAITAPAATGFSSFLAFADNATGIGSLGSNTLGFSTNNTEVARFDNTGNMGIGSTTNLTKLTVNGPVAVASPTAVTASTYTVLAADAVIIFSTSATCTVTLPAAASYPGRILNVINRNAQAINSASSNVVSTTGTTSTTILSNTSGKWAILQSNGTNWLVLANN